MTAAIADLPVSSSGLAEPDDVGAEPRRMTLFDDVFGLNPQKVCLNPRNSGLGDTTISRSASKGSKIKYGPCVGSEISKLVYMNSTFESVYPIGGRNAASKAVWK